MNVIVTGAGLAGRNTLMMLTRLIYSYSSVKEYENTVADV